MKKSGNQKLGILLLIILFIGIVILFGFLILKPDSKQTGKVISPILDIAEKTKTSKLPIIFEKNFSNEKQNFAVVIKNLKTGEEFRHNADKKFGTASLYKLWTLVIAKEQVEKGILNEENILSSEKQKLDDSLSGSTPTPTPDGYQEPEDVEKEIVSILVGTAIEKMITTSDNYSAILLSNKIGLKNISDFLEDNSFDDSNYNIPPKTSANDISKFFEKLYKGEFISREVSDEMIEILKNQQINDRIPKYLPKDTEVAHKTGELLGIKHDAGIVFTKDGDYIIVVLSQTDNETEAAEKIAEFSKDVYEYFTN